MASWRERARSTRDRYHLHAIAPASAEAVAVAGGWLLDHALAGWRVTVWLQDCDDAQPFRILGATPRDLRAAWQRFEVDDDASGVILRSSEYCHDYRLRTRLLDALDASPTDSIVWLHTSPPDEGTPFKRIDHRLSRTALIFKDYAIAAIGVETNVGP
ncbi:MAG: hypothetical protein WAL26_14100, partial [Mycobacterium sp.]